MAKIRKKYKEPHFKINVILMLLGVAIDFIGAIMNDMAPVTVGSCLFGINLLIIMIKMCRISNEADAEER